MNIHEQNTVIVFLNEAWMWSTIGPLHWFSSKGLCSDFNQGRPVNRSY